MGEYRRRLTDTESQKPSNTPVVLPDMFSLYSMMRHVSKGRHFVRGHVLFRDVAFASHFSPDNCCCKVILHIENEDMLITNSLSA